MAKRLFARFFVFAAVIMFMSSNAFAANDKLDPAVIGVIDIQKIHVKSTAIQSIRSKRDGYIEKYRSAAVKEEQRIREADKKLAKQKGVLSEEAFNKKAKALRAEMIAFSRKVQAQKAAVERSFMQALSDYQKKYLMPIVMEVSKAKGVNIVLNKSQVLIYDSEKMDITKEVLEATNKKAPTAKFPEPVVKTKKEGNRRF
ncbi:MAG: OmpH family outer membrane protein [Alphaproteobacteria bacterium]|nr:OmpH family outer membrane protein [Alphaproteobacteria bacterium]